MTYNSFSFTYCNVTVFLFQCSIQFSSMDGCQLDVR